MSLLAPTSSFTIVVNTLFARLILGEKMTSMAYIGSAIIVVGAVTCTIFGSKESHQRSADELKNLFVREGYLHYQGVNCAFFTLSLLLSLVLIPMYFSDVDAQLEAERAVAKAQLALEGKPGPLALGESAPLSPKNVNSAGSPEDSNPCPPLHATPGVDATAPSDVTVELVVQDTGAPLSPKNSTVDGTEVETRERSQSQLAEDEASGIFNADSCHFNADLTPIHAILTLI